MVVCMSEVVNFCDIEYWRRRVELARRDGGGLC